MKVEYIYVAPAMLCNTAVFSGVIPYWFCLDGAVFANLAIFIFVMSIFLHIYILMQWRKYRNYSPLAYGLAQPIVHLIILAFALRVGSISKCDIENSPPLPESEVLKDYNF